MTYQQERKIKDAARAKRVQKFRYVPVFMDKWAKHLSGLSRGSKVIKVQPHGCPRNGTMGMAYIGDGKTGEFIGMVCLGSLVAEKDFVPSVDDGITFGDLLAAKLEHRERA